MKGFWTDDALTSLKDFWNRGWSASQIASQLRTTRNAVLGKVHRLGLSGRVVPVSAEDLARREERRRQKHAERERLRRGRLATSVAPRPARVDLPAPTYLGYALDIPFADLRPLSSGGVNQCRYIAAEPPGPQYLACGNETRPGESYCAHCLRIVIRADTRVVVAAKRPARVRVAA